MMPLAAFAAQLAEHIAHERGWTLQDARAWVDHHLDAARARVPAGAPLPAKYRMGFSGWLLERILEPPARMPPYARGPGRGVVASSTPSGRR